MRQLRPLKSGAEFELQETLLLGGLDRLLNSNSDLKWIGGSVKIGNGFPDITFVEAEKFVLTWCDLQYETSDLLAYLRAVKTARISTIAKRFGQDEVFIRSQINSLVDISSSFSEPSDVIQFPRELTNPLPRVCTIEVKVRAWKRAIHQAIRNRAFANETYVALPERFATRVRNMPLVRQWGIGVIGISDSGQLQLMRVSTKLPPRIWSYYYRLAVIVAREIRGFQNGFQGSHRRSQEAISTI
jgi:hypothetical protein